MGVILEVLAGFAAGVLAGLTGVGGGVLLVPVLVAMGFSALPAIGTSNFAILISSTSGTVTNTLRFGLPWRRATAQRAPRISSSTGHHVSDRSDSFAASARR